MAAVRIRPRFLRPQRDGKTLEATLEFAEPPPNSSEVMLVEKAPTSRSVGRKHGGKTNGSANLQVNRLLLTA